MDLKKILESRTTTLLLLALITIFGIHTVVQNGQELRLDLTQDNLYSLSEGTLGILDKMQDEGVKPIDIHLYFSETVGKSLPRFIKDFLTYEKYLRSLLREYEVASNGKIRVRFVDPLTDSDEAQDAQALGLEGKPINQHGDVFFFGLAMQTQTGSKDVMEFLWPNQQETVEYEISKRIHGLIWPTRERIGVLSSLEVISEATNPYMAQILAAQGKNPGESWISMKLLEETYQVSKIDTDTDFIDPEAFDLVVVIHPKNLNDRAIWALDEWIARGGNALIFLDPYALDDRPPQNPQQPWAAYQYEPSSNLDKLLRGWGLEMPAGEIVADRELANKRVVRQFSPAERVLVDLQIDQQVAKKTLATDHPIFKGLENLRFFHAGGLRELAGEGDAETMQGVTRTPLVTTTAEGNLLAVKAGFPGDGDLVFLDLFNEPGKVSDRFEPGTEPVALAYMVQGQLGPIFADGAQIPGPTPAPPPGLPPGIDLPPPTSDEVISKEPVPVEERKEATVLVFADVDLISDQVAFQNTPFGAIPLNDNYKVLLNTVDFLFGSEDLMKVRSKKPVRRPFTLFDRIEADADERTLEREQELRAEIATFEEQLREKQSAANNQALFKKQLQDEVDQLNERIVDANRELIEIRKNKRAELEEQENFVRITTLAVTPSLVLVLGLFLLFRRRNLDQKARRRSS